MSLFKNNYERLKEENNEEIARLSGENWNPLKRMMDYTASFDVSLFELEVIKKDLIGIAKEADAQNEDLTEKIGVSEKEFCNSLIKGGGMKHIGWERVLLSVRYAVLLLFLFYTIEFVLEGFSVNYGFSSRVILLAFLCGGCEFLLRRFLIPRITYMEKKKRSGIILIGFVLWIIVAIPFMISDNIDSFLIHGNGWVMLIVMALLAALVNCGNNYYWDKCSEKYSWQ